MAFDGIVVAGIAAELREKLIGGRIVKIAQPERDELILTVKNYDQYLLFMSADAGLPLIYLTDSKKESPLNSPSFCMLLRKHLTGARITDIVQPDFERIIYIELEHLDELGDPAHKRLIIEIMGKHSNIIFCDDKGRILDSIKHVPSSMSSVREVLPGRDYFIPKTLDKSNPCAVTEEGFKEALSSYNGDVVKAIYMSYTGLSPLTANEIVFRAGIDPEIPSKELPADHLTHLYRIFRSVIDDVVSGEFYPNIIQKDKKAVEFSGIRLTSYESDPEVQIYEASSVSDCLIRFYSRRNAESRIKQKSSDLRHIVATVTERETRKYELQLKQLKDTEKRDKYKLYGELLSAFGYNIPGGAKEAVLNNYYTGEDITVPLDPDISAIDNAKSYYDKYAKLKRTYEALTKLTGETSEALEHLGSLKVALDIAEIEDDLTAIKDELIEYGYMRDKARGRNSRVRKGGRSGSRLVSKPFRYQSVDGMEILVGKNNFQNEELTFKLSKGDDWWFHAKGVPGSHVILRTDGREVSDRAFEEAAALAAYYSANRDNEKVEVDYLLKKNVKKPNGGRPGFVIYYTNYSMVVRPKIDEIGTEKV